MLRYPFPSFSIGSPNHVLALNLYLGKSMVSKCGHSMLASEAFEVWEPYCKRINTYLNA